MPDTIQNSALTALIPDKTKTFVFLGGTLAVLADGDTYPGDLKQIPLSKIAISIEVEKGAMKGPNQTLKFLENVRTWIKSMVRNVKIESQELKNETVLALFNDGPIHGKFKLQAKEDTDPDGVTSLLLGEFEAWLSLDGSLDGTQGEATVASMSLDIEGTVALVSSIDTEAPTVPTGLAAGSVAATSLTLTWTPSTDNVAVTGYEVFQDGVSIATPSSPTHGVTGLVAETEYDFTVRARDAAGNWSAQSAELTQATTA